MDDYYSYKPLHRLSRPLAMCGLPGAHVGKTVRALNLLTGMPFIWLDRRVEHELGASVEVVQVKQGVGARLDIERRILEALGAERTPPLVALSDVTFTDLQVRTTLLETCDVVCLYLPAEESVARVKAESGADRRKHYALLHETDDLPARITQLAEGYARVARRVEIQGRTPMEVAQEVLDRFVQEP